MRRIELLLCVGTALAALAAIVATIFLPTASTGLSVDGNAPIIHSIYARDTGMVRMIAVIAFIALLAACVLLGGYFHSRRGATLGRAIVVAAAASYVVLTAVSVRQDAFAVYPTLLAVACALVALLPTRSRPTPSVDALPQHQDG